MQAEEAAIRRHERSETDVGECDGILELRNERGKPFPQVSWSRVLPFSVSRVVIIDADLYTLAPGKDGTPNALQEDAAAAMELVGDKGCLIVVMAAPNHIASGKALVAEQGASGEVA